MQKIILALMSFFMVKFFHLYISVYIKIKSFYSAKVVIVIEYYIQIEIKHNTGWYFL